MSETIFYGCNNLKCITYRGKYNLLYDMGTILEGLTIYVNSTYILASDFFMGGNAIAYKDVRVM